MLVLLFFLICTMPHCYGWHGVVLCRDPVYAKLAPPRILQTNDCKTVKAGSTHTLRCVGSRDVSWMIPGVEIDVHSDLRSRISISYDEKNLNKNVSIGEGPIIVCQGAV